MGEPTSKQMELANKLSEYDKHIGDSYLGALHVLCANDYPTRLNHFAYSLREVIDMLTRHNQSEKERKQSMDEKTRRKCLRRLFPSKDETNYKYMTLTETHSKLNEIVHGKTSMSNEDALEKVSTIEKILYMLTTSQLSAIDKFDRIVSNEPSDENAIELVKMAANTATQSYIVDKLPTTWFPFMVKADFFRMPLKGEYWMAHRYLYKCLDKYPQDVTDVMTSYHVDTVEYSPVIYGNFLQFMLRLSADHAEKIAMHMLEEEWYKFFVHYPDHHMNAVEKLYLDERYDVACDMAYHALTSIIKPNEDSMMYSWLETILRDKIPKMIKKNPIPIFQKLVRLLEDFINSDTEHSSKEYQTSLFIKRASIEDSDQNWSQGIESILVEYIRDCVLCVNKNSKELVEITNIIKEKDMLIFRRLEMFIYNKFPSLFKDQIANYAIEYFDSQLVDHEYYIMLKNHFSLLSPSLKNEILRKIGVGFEVDEFNRTQAKWGKERAERLQRRWQYRYLDAINKDLDDAHRSQYLKLHEEFGKLEHPEYTVYHSSGERVGITTPISFADKSADEVFRIIKNIRPKSQHDDSVVAFNQYVTNNPLDCSKRSAELEGSDINIQAAFFDGLDRARKDEMDLDWKNIVSLIRHIGLVTNNEKPLTDQRRVLLTDICSLLRFGFTGKHMEFKLQDILWESIKALVKAGTLESDPQDYNTYTDEVVKRSDFHSMSINSINGMSFHVLILYMIWHAENNSNIIDLKAQDIIDKYVKNTRSHTVLRHVTLGIYFSALHDLNKQWATYVLENIDSCRVVELAFWEGCVVGQRLDTDAFSDMHDWYAKFLNKDITYSLKMTELYKWTVNHSILAYLLDIEKADDVAEQFLEHLKKESKTEEYKELIEHCVFQIFRILDSIPRQSLNKDKIASLWKNPAFSSHDLSLWFLHSTLDKKTTICLYRDYLEKYTGKIRFPNHLMDGFRKYTSKFPTEVICCIDKLIDNAEDWYIPDNIENILKRLLSHKNEEMYQECERIIDKLLERNVDLRRLL